METNTLQKAKIFDPTSVSLVFFAFFIFSLFFSVRYTFVTPYSFSSGIFSDFTSFSVYLSDILIIISFSFICVSRETHIRLINWHKNPYLWLVFWLILNLFWNFKDISILNGFFVLRVVIWLVAYGTGYFLFKTINFREKKSVFGLIIAFSTVEAFLATFQFLYQRSLGLGMQKLGEQVLSPEILGIAKIVSSGTSYIRSYGTFVHPNILGLFMLISIIILLTISLKEVNIWKKCLIYVILFINTFGLMLTFSRSAIISLTLCLILYFSVYLYSNLRRGQAGNATKMTYFSIIIMVFCLFSSSYILKDYLVTRGTVFDKATLERVHYTKIAWRMIKDYPIFGIGAGESVLHMEQYSKTKLWPWQIQPIHNYFLIFAAELGLFAGIGAVLILFSNIKSLLKSLKRNFEIYHLALICILVSFVLLMQFDHYFYTIVPAQMVLWTFLGIVSAETKE